MKKNLKQALVPLAVMVFGAAAAFATNAAKQSDKADETAMIGYYYDHTATGSKCKPVTVECNTISGPICTNQNPDDLVQYWRNPTEVDLQCSGLLFLNSN